MNAQPETKDTLTVMDLFCGAGGFSEGFRAAGFKVVHGEDVWQAAIDTFNAAFDLNMKPRDLLYFEGDPNRIDQLPNTHVIVGSPPCVSFSYSNKLGNGDKTLGVRLTKVFLRIVAVKKWQSGSVLKAWFMENVPNAGKWLKCKYSFRSLGLTNWAIANGKHPTQVAIDLAQKVGVLDSAFLGVPQARKRLFIVDHLDSGAATPLEPRAKVSLAHVLSTLPPPNTKAGKVKLIVDPLHPEIEIEAGTLSDHYYDSGCYEAHWRESRYLKENHPYMGRMSFPEKLNRPARTVVATNLARCREAILLRSEWGHNGDGEYRTLTVREAASLMSFPITYQFAGNEAAKWKLVGNAVCPLVSAAFANQLNQCLGRQERSLPRKVISTRANDFPNLNTFAARSYISPPRRLSNAKFRRHPIKEAAMTVALTNYSLATRGRADGVWRCFVTDGIGNGYRVRRLSAKNLPLIKQLVLATGIKGERFARAVGNGFAHDVLDAKQLQRRFEADVALKDPLNPAVLMERAAALIRKHASPGASVRVSRALFIRDEIPETQLLAAYAVCHVVALANERRGSK